MLPGFGREFRPLQCKFFAKIVCHTIKFGNFDLWKA